MLLGVRGPGELGGELAALGSRPAATITTAVEPAEVGFMSATDLRAFLIERPRVALAALRELAARLDHSQRRRVEQSSGNRLALAGAGLLELAERYGQQTELGVRVELPLAPDALAGLFDADPETVARALRLMRRLGWVSMSRSDIVVHDLEAMRRRRSAEWR